MKSGLAAVLLVMAASLATLPLFLHPTLPRGDDVGQHVQFVQDVAAGLVEGRLYPRWLGHANLGYGAPAFIFYPPLATIFISLIHLTGLTLISSFKVGAWLMTAAAAVTGALLGRQLSGSRGSPWAAAWSGALLVLLPYHAVDLFNRFALAELAVFIFLPLYFLYLEQPRRLMLGGTAFAFLCLAHLPMAYLAALTGGVWILGRCPRALPRFLASLALGAAVAAVYWIPAVAERHDVHADWLEQHAVYRFDAHYIFGGGRIDVRDDPIKGLAQDEVILTTPGQVRAAALLTLLIALPAWALRRMGMQRGWLTQGDPLDRYAWLAVASLILMTRLADPLWRHVPGLASVAFPWRLTLFLSLAAAVLAGSLLGAMRRPAQSLAAGALIMTVMVLACMRLAAAADWQSFTAAHALTPVVRQRVSGAFMPRSNPSMRGFRFLPRAGPAALIDAEGERHPGAVRVQVRTNHLLRLEVDADPVGGMLEVPIFDYPGWRARVDGRKQLHQRGPLGVMHLALPPGTHEVEWRFTATPVRRAAAAISILGVLAVAFLTLRSSDRTMEPKGLP